MQIGQLLACFEDSLADVTFFDLHMIYIAVYMLDTRMVHSLNVAFGIGYCVAKADLSGADGFDRCLYFLLNK